MRREELLRMSWATVARLDTPFKQNGRKYEVRIEGEQRKDGTWAGRVVFVDGNSTRATSQETSQPNRQALEYWGTGLEPIYLEGALKRSK